MVDSAGSQETCLEPLGFVNAFEGEAEPDRGVSSIPARPISPV